MSSPNPSQRILTGFGESDTFLGLTFTDLKILLPAVFVGLLIAGNTPPAFSTLGWGVAGAIVLGSLITIYATPDDQTPQAWLLDRYRFITQPNILTLRGKDELADSPDATLRPETQQSSSMPTSRISNRSSGKSTQELTSLKRFYVSREAASRSDGYLFGAIQVKPANMALTTQENWEQVCRSFARVVNGIGFPFQIYSTVTPVDPSRIISGYRERLREDSLEDKPQFRELIQAYERDFPREFAHRGTSIRKFYVVVPVSQLDVQRSSVSVGHTGLLETLADLPYVGGFFTTIGASRQGYSPEELKARQIVELTRRLDVVADGIRSIDGCDSTRLETPELVALLRDFWDPDHPDTEATSILRTTPVISTEDSIATEGSS